MAAQEVGKREVLFVVGAIHESPLPGLATSYVQLTSGTRFTLAGCFARDAGQLEWEMFRSAVPDSVFLACRREGSKMDDIVRAFLENELKLRLVKQIGRGGFAEVWEAESESGIHSAVKVSLDSMSPLRCSHIA